MSLRVTDPNVTGVGWVGRWQATVAVLYRRALSLGLAGAPESGHQIGAYSSIPDFCKVLHQQGHTSADVRCLQDLHRI